MVGCGKSCEAVYTGDADTLDMDFAWVPSADNYYMLKTGEKYTLGGFRDRNCRGCGDWYNEYWQLICITCLRREGLLW